MAEPTVPVPLTKAEIEALLYELPDYVGGTHPLRGALCKLQDAYEDVTQSEGRKR